MLRLILGVLILGFVVAVGCGGSSSSDGIGGTGGVGGAGGDGGAGGTLVEPRPTCTAFCAKVIGQCQAFAFDEAACAQGCERDLLEEEAKSEVCGDAVEAVFDCAAELGCQAVEDWRDREPIDAYPCRSAVEMADLACP
jgi:hypothetical protein